MGHPLLTSQTLGEILGLEKGMHMRPVVQISDQPM